MNDLLRRALEGRLREVLEVLRDAGPADAAPGAAHRVPPRPDPRESSGGPMARADLPEESLRRLMVSVLARVRDRPASGPDRALFFELLAELEPAARTEDLRYLDAWNSACEALLTWPREELARHDARRELLAYASILEGHLRRLERRS